MKRVAVTGAHGFLGWHLCCRLRATRGLEPTRLGRDDFQDADALRRSLADVDTAIHLAGVNRAATDDEVEAGNLELATTLATALDGRPVHVVYADSIQAELDNPYGRGKRGAAETLARLPGTLADVRLPNLFGEHGRPGYNSFVATFCHEVAGGRRAVVQEDREVLLLHVQDAAEALLRAAERPESTVMRPDGQPVRVTEVLHLLDEFHGLYAGTGEIPDLSSGFRRDLFNTYRSHLFPEQFPIHPEVHADERGALFEAVRAHAGPGMAFVSTTRPGKVRGDHYHLRKIERFLVVSGEAEISLRRLLHDEIVTFRVAGDRPGLVDMPTMWVHNIRNVGSSDLVTMFWADQLLDVANPDQYPEKVVQEVTS